MKPAQQKRINQTFEDRRYDDRKRRHVADVAKDFRGLMVKLCEVCPDGRQLNSALRHLEEGFHWALTAIFSAEQEE